MITIIECVSAAHWLAAIVPGVFIAGVIVGVVWMRLKYKRAFNWEKTLNKGMDYGS